MGEAWSHFRADVERYGAPRGVRAVAIVLQNQGLWASGQYRFSRWARTSRARPVLRPLVAVSLKLVEMTTGISLSGRAQIGPGLYIGHFGGIIIGSGAVIGPGCTLSQGVTVGTSVSGDRGSPVIEEGVYIAPGAKVFGPIRIGARTAIGANAVVNRDIPADAVAVGVPARPLKR